MLDNIVWWLMNVIEQVEWRFGVVEVDPVELVLNSTLGDFYFHDFFGNMHACMPLIISLYTFI